MVVSEWDHMKCSFWLFVLMSIPRGRRRVVIGKKHV